MKKLLIVGAGSFAIEVEELARLVGYEDISFLDDSPETARVSPVIGNLEDLQFLRNQYDTAIVAFGNNALRMKWLDHLKEYGYSIPTLIHPRAYVSPDAVLQEGCIVRAMAMVGRYVHLGRGCIVNAAAVINHDCIVEDGCHCLIGSIIRNKRKVDAMTWVATGSLIE